MAKRKEWNVAIYMVVNGFVFKGQLLGRRLVSLVSINQKGLAMKGILLWLCGVPISIIILLYIFVFN